MNDQRWHSDHELNEIVARSPMAVKSNLNFLRGNRNDTTCSQLELAKFGFPVTHLEGQDLSGSCAYPETLLRFGSFPSRTHNTPSNADSLKFGNF